jgi:uncharacterized protein involved in exopolysaccharide biosynthesis
VTSIRRGWRERRDDLAVSEVLHVLWERRLLVVALVVVPALGSVVLVLFGGPTYTAEAAVSVRPREELGAGEDPESFLDEVVGAVVSEDFLREVSRRAGWKGGEEEFRERLDVQTFVGSDEEPALRVRFSGSEAEGAARAANAYAELFVEKVEQLNDQRIAGGALAADARVEEEAAVPEGWSRLRPLLYAAAAAVAGLVLGSVGAMLFEGRTRSWRDARDAEFTLQAPVLGVIPEFPPAEEEEERA